MVSCLMAERVAPSPHKQCRSISACTLRRRVLAVGHAVLTLWTKTSLGIHIALLSWASDLKPFLCVAAELDQGRFFLPWLVGSGRSLADRCKSPHRNLSAYDRSRYHSPSNGSEGRRGDHPPGLRQSRPVDHPHPARPRLHRSPRRSRDPLEL
jgi:hypothetical protein